MFSSPFRDWREASIRLSAAETQKDDGGENKPKDTGGGYKREAERKIGDLLLIYGQKQLTVNIWE